MRWFIGVCLFLSLLCWSCRGDKVRILSEKTMEDVLFDYHIAEGIARFENADTALAQRYIEAVFEKHDITKEEFDSSMVFYMKHADRLHGIYEHLSDRFTNEGRLQGVESNSLVASYTLEGDTANIWPLEKERVFSTYVPDNLLRYSIAADTTFLPGDKFILSFRSDFLYQEGMRNGFAMFSIRYENDSVVTRTKQISAGNVNTFEVSDDKRIGAKEILGYFLLRPPAKADNGAVLRLMVLSDIQLIKMHTDEPEGFVKEENKPIAVDSLDAQRDTLNNIKENVEKNDNEKEIKPAAPASDDKHSD